MKFKSVTWDNNFVIVTKPLDESVAGITTAFNVANFNRPLNIEPLVDDKVIPMFNIFLKFKSEVRFNNFVIWFKYFADKIAGVAIKLNKDNLAKPLDIGPPVFESAKAIFDIFLLLTSDTVFNIFVILAKFKEAKIAGIAITLIVDNFNNPFAINPEVVDKTTATLVKTLELIDFTEFKLLVIVIRALDAIIAGKAKNTALANEANPFDIFGEMNWIVDARFVKFL